MQVLIDMEELCTEWARLRNGVLQVTAAAAGGRRGATECILCGAKGGGVGHLAAACPDLVAARREFLRKSQVTSLREGTEPGLWLNTIFAHPADVAVLAEPVRFAGAMGRLVRAAKKAGPVESHGS